MLTGVKVFTVRALATTCAETGDTVDLNGRQERVIGPRRGCCAERGRTGA